MVAGGKPSDKGLGVNIHRGSPVVFSGDVIQVDEGTLVNEVPKDIIHRGSENCWDIGEGKRNYEVFKLSNGFARCDLPFIPL